MSNKVNNSGLISSGCFRQYCDYDVPYCGIIDDGKGTTALVNSDIDVVKRLDGSILYYSKKIRLRIDKVIHTVRKGDSLWKIAQNLGVSVEDIVASNNIEDDNLIHVGDILTINVDIKYGYQVETTIDLDSFTDKVKKDGYNPLSESKLFQILDNINSYADGLGGALADNAGKSRIGNNFRFYVEKSSGRVFGGNQYVKTYALREMGNSIAKYTQPLKIGKVALPLAIAFEGVEIYDGLMEDSKNGNISFGHNTQKQIVGAVGGITGGLLGAKYGAMAGGAIGAWIGGAGAVPGAIIGGLVFGILGGIYGEKWTESIYESLTK